MLDNDRLRADAEDAEVFSQMARSRLLAAKASRDRLAARWNQAQGGPTAIDETERAEPGAGDAPWEYVRPRNA